VVVVVQGINLQLQLFLVDRAVADHMPISADQAAQ
jgi:hypothetical protein